MFARLINCMEQSPFWEAIMVLQELATVPSLESDESTAYPAILA
jgi:hypothetical protein